MRPQRGQETDLVIPEQNKSHQHPRGQNEAFIKPITASVSAGLPTFTSARRLEPAALTAASSELSVRICQDC